MKDATMTMSDLVQVGTQGLLKALTKFNVGRGYRLSTYATPWIKTYMQRACQDEGAVLRWAPDGLA
ncbi:RNA polymerase sigma factor, partial [Haematococcus lacustris]